MNRFGPTQEDIDVLVDVNKEIVARAFCECLTELQIERSEKNFALLNSLKNKLMELGLNFDPVLKIMRSMTNDNS